MEIDIEVFELLLILGPSRENSYYILNVIVLFLDKFILGLECAP